MKVLILTADSNGGYPVPAVKGGAVSTLIEHLVSVNNEKKLCDMEILSLYDNAAEEKSKEYQNIRFKWVKVPRILKLFDKCVFNFVHIILKKEKAISFKSPFSLIYYIFKAKKVIRNTDANKIVLENNIPLVHVIKNSSFKGEWYYHFHNIPRIDAACRNEFKRVSKYLCVSQFVANQICSNDSAIGRIDTNKATVLLNCVDTKLFRPIERSNPQIIKLREKFDIHNNDFVLIFAGRLTKEKGPDVLLKALKSLPDNVKVILVGSLIYNVNVNSPYQEELHNLAENLKNRVFFTGYMPQDKLPYIYNLADIAVLPSIWDEPAGLTIIEAMACGTPVITTNTGGIPEYVGEYGHVLDRENDLVYNICKAINDYTHDNKEWKIKANAGVDYISKEFCPEKYLVNFLKCIS